MRGDQTRIRWEEPLVSWNLVGGSVCVCVCVCVCVLWYGVCIQGVFLLWFQDSVVKGVELIIL